MNHPEKVAALCEAVAKGDVAYARRVLADGAEPDETIDEGVPPLALAAANGDLDMMNALIEAGADVNFKCEAGLSVLAVAIQKGHLPAVKLLLAKGADANKRVFDGGRAVLHMAAVMGAAEIIKALAHGGADVEIKDASGCTPMMMAIGAAKKESVEALKSCGAVWPDKSKTSKKTLPDVIKLGME